MAKQKLIFCTQKVNRNMIRRENRDGVEHIVLTSYTLPPNIVMNGGLYPEDEVNNSFDTLNRTPVTVEHPKINGSYVSASDPETDFDYRFGAFNENARKMSDGRIQLDKVINVQKALKTEKGKRLLDRLNALEKSNDAEPIHTSVGVFTEVEELAEMATNDSGQEYGWIARNMIFDHDAILLDSQGAATPEQGTGIGINSEQVKVETFFIANDEDEEVKEPVDLRSNADTSFSDVCRSLNEQLNAGLPEGQYRYIEEVYNDYFIYVTESGEMFRAEYAVDDNGNIGIHDTRLPVERVVEYKPLNQPSEESAMRDSIIAELEGMGISVNAELSDAELLAKYNEALSANDGDDNAEDIATVVANAVSAAMQPLTDEIESLKANTDNTNEKINVIKANSEFANLSDTVLKAIAVNDKAEFDSMYAKSVPSHGIGSTHLNANTSNKTVTSVSDLPA